ncbi:MAG: hypothetical protein IT447_16305 [Phycisphaerales bacterium]|nr:hypothetical protein [Phycisphaerales bacterium]
MGVPIPRGTPHEAQVEAIRHVLNRHPELTPDDIAKLPGVVRNPDWIGATDKKGYKRIWLLKQNGNDQLYLAVYGENNGRLRLKTYYTGEQGTILAELKNKGVPLATVANPAVHPVREPGMPSPGLLASEGMPNKNVTIPPQPSSVKQNPTEATPSIATGNRGTFDQANPDIRYSIAANAGPLNIPQRQPQPVVKPKAADNVQAGERFAGKAWPMILEVNHDPDYPFLLLSQGLDLLALVD